MAPTTAPRMHPNGPVMMPSKGPAFAVPLGMKRSGPKNPAENPIPPTTKAPSKAELARLARNPAVCVQTYHATPAATRNEPRELIQEGKRSKKVEGIANQKTK